MTKIFLLALSLSCATASAAAPKGKAGDACKADTDCDQSAGKQTCTNGKCKGAEKPVPPPTTNTPPPT